MSQVAVRRTARLVGPTAVPLAADEVISRPTLTVVPRRRRAAGFAVFLSMLVAGLMLGAAVLHTRLAERQLRIDRLERAVSEYEAQFDVLRRQRAELRSPTRLAEEAAALGMRHAAESMFVGVDPMTVAVAIAATGKLPDAEQVMSALQPLDQYRLVKDVTNGTP